MGIKFVIAVTDGEWFEMLRQQPNLREVNFWSPSAKPFRALQPGELFLFKLHAPHHMIVGGGVFAHATKLPCSLAWEAFGEANGARSAEKMRVSITGRKTSDTRDRSDFEIGCRILTQPFFFEEEDWIPVPPVRSPIKKYDTGNAEDRDLWDAIVNLRDRPKTPGMGEPTVRYGEPQIIRPRLGQGAFRVLVTDTYQRRCAVTRERTLPALEAAHIRPYSEEGKHEVRNGLLLRRDIHKLFDTGYVTVTPDLHFEVSRRIKEEYENGRDYYAMHGRSISAPEKSDWRPDPVELAWHNENCFRE